MPIATNTMSIGVQTFLPSFTVRSFDPSYSSLTLMKRRSTRRMKFSAFASS